jgi:hypothetical protein
LFKIVLEQIKRETVEVEYSSSLSLEHFAMMICLVVSERIDRHSFTSLLGSKSQSYPEKVTTSVRFWGISG